MPFENVYVGGRVVKRRMDPDCAVTHATLPGSLSKLVLQALRYAQGADGARLEDIRSSLTSHFDMPVPLRDFEIMAVLRKAIIRGMVVQKEDRYFYIPELMTRSVANELRYFLSS